jgi:cytochrome P450
MPLAAKQSRLPTNSEIHDTTIPYLDAAIEEVFRCTKTVTFNSRDAVCDTTILGQFIPKGTIVFMTQGGNGITLPPFPIDETKRSETSRAAHGKTPEWDVDDMGEFVPERWLKDGKFDSRAGMNLSFGLGTRGCYGRRLAYLELRTLLTLIVWRFELQNVPDELAGYEAIDGITHKPTKCFVQLVPAY